MSSFLPPFPWDRPAASHEYVDWFVKLREIINASGLDHNTLLNLQGGAANAYYHLNQAEYTALTTDLQQTIENYSMPTYAKRYDEFTATVSYLGEAEEGSAESAAVWRIQRLTFSGNDLEVVWADGNSNFDNIWDDRASLSYS